MSCLVAGFGPGIKHVAKQDCEGFVAYKVARDEHGVAQAQRYLLTRVAHLHHVADLAYHFRLVFLASFFQKRSSAGAESKWSSMEFLPCR